MISADFSAARWTKSSHSGNTTNCVEIAFAERVVGVRDSKNAEGGTLVFTATQWQAFTRDLGKR